MNVQKAIDKLAKIGQSHLLKFWDTLSAEQQTHLLIEIEQLDLPTLKTQQQLLHTHDTPTRYCNPFLDYTLSGNASNMKVGKKLIAEGLLGCLILAGGQGSRLQLEGPKGMYPITPITHKSLFQLFAEKTLAAGKQAGRPLLLAIMTSPINHKATVDFFRNNDFFGLDAQHVSFFSQKMLPLLDKEGNLFLEEKDTIAKGPDGNGAALNHFYEQGIWNSWEKQGIQYLNMIVIDNPLADPYDAELLGYQWHKQSDIALKCTPKTDPKENVGVLAIENNKTVVIEYSELSEEQRFSRLPDGSLSYQCANLSLMCFNMNFIKAFAKRQDAFLPLHKALKAAKYIDDSGKSVPSEKPMAWKFEKFIFDLFPLASKIDALLCPREACFAPLKNLHGPDSPSTVQASLIASDQKKISEITGMPCNISPIEIPQEFYYPTPELIVKWQGKTYL